MQSTHSTPCCTMSSKTPSLCSQWASQSITPLPEPGAHQMSDSDRPSHNPATHPNREGAEYLTSVLWKHCIPLAFVNMCCHLRSYDSCMPLVFHTGYFYRGASRSSCSTLATSRKNSPHAAQEQVWTVAWKGGWGTGTLKSVIKNEGGPLHGCVEAAIAIRRPGNSAWWLQDHPAFLCQTWQRSLLSQNSQPANIRQWGTHPCASISLLLSQSKQLVAYYSRDSESFLDNMWELDRMVDGPVALMKVQELKHLLEENKLRGIQAKVGVLLEELPRCSICGCAGHDIPAHRIPARTSICQHATLGVDARPTDKQGQIQGWQCYQQSESCMPGLFSCMQPRKTPTMSLLHRTRKGCKHVVGIWRWLHALWGASCVASSEKLHRLLVTGFVSDGHVACSDTMVWAASVLVDRTRSGLWLALWDLSHVKPWRWKSLLPSAHLTAEPRP